MMLRIVALLLISILPLSSSRHILDAATGRLDCGNSSDWRLLGDMSLGFWLKIGSTASNAGTAIILAYLDSGETEAANAMYDLILTGASFAWDIRYVHEQGAGTNETVDFDANIPNNTWVYIGVTRRIIDKSVALWLGKGSALQLVSRGLYTTDPTGGDSATSVLQFFALAGGVSQNDSLTIENFSLHNRALSVTEHLNQMRGVRIPSGQVAYMPFNAGISPEPNLTSRGKPTCSVTSVVVDDKAPVLPQAKLIFAPAASTSRRVISVN